MKLRNCFELQIIRSKLKYAGDITGVVPRKFVVWELGACRTKAAHAIAVQGLVEEHPLSMNEIGIATATLQQKPCSTLATVD